jgi:hypothetical protein
VLCAVYTVHVETRSIGFLVEPQNQGRRVVNGLASKSIGRFSPILPQNRWLRSPIFSVFTSALCRLMVTARSSAGDRIEIFFQCTLRQRSALALDPISFATRAFGSHLCNHHPVLGLACLHSRFQPLVTTSRSSVSACFVILPPVNSHS